MLLNMVATADLCATSATTSALCPAVSDDSSQSLCPDLALGATCSALAGKQSPLLAVVTKQAASPSYYVLLVMHPYGIMQSGISVVLHCDDTESINCTYVTI